MHEVAKLTDLLIHNVGGGRGLCLYGLDFFEFTEDVWIQGSLFVTNCKSPQYEAPETSGNTIKLDICLLHSKNYA